MDGKKRGRVDCSWRFYLGRQRDGCSIYWKKQLWRKENKFHSKQIEFGHPEVAVQWRIKSMSLGLGKLPVLEIIWGTGWDIWSKKQRGYRTESWRRSIYKVWTEKKKSMKGVNRGHKRDRKSVSISGMLRKESILRNVLSVKNTSGFKEKNDKTIYWHIRGSGWENRKSEDGIFLREKRFMKVIFRILAGEREKDKIITLIAKLELFWKD